jgi:hypothetical protein
MHGLTSSVRLVAWLQATKNARQVAVEKKERAMQAAADLKAKADAEQIARKAAEEAAAKVRPSLSLLAELYAEQIVDTHPVCQND